MIVINDDTRDSQVQNKKKDTQQDTKIASLQASVDSINAQITAINSSVSALSNTIDDKYSAQTQALMSALTNQINALSESLSALISTNQINAGYGNFERLAVTVSAAIESVAAVVLNVSDKATIKEAEVISLKTVNETVTSLTATEATLQRAVIDSLSIVSNFRMRALSAESANISDLNSTQISVSQKVTTPEIYTKVITGTTWQTPIGTPDNTELLKITVPHYEGIIQLITEDREFNVSIFNNSLFTWTEQSGYLFRIQRNAENTEIYLENIGDTVNYQLLFIGSKNTVTATSEIVDKTGIRQNVYTYNGVYGAGSGEGGSGSQIIFVDELPSAGEEGIIYLSKALGAWVWNEDDGELVPLTGTDLPEAVQTNTENIGNLSDLTTTADSDLVSAINELDSDVGDLTSLTTTTKTSLAAAINEVDSNTDTNTGAIATINGNDTGLSMRQVAQDVTGNVYIPCGSVLFANLPSLSSARIGSVYNVEDSFTTTADFVEGAGITISAGSNVVAVDSNGVKKWDVLGVSIDTSSFMTKHNPTGTGAFSMGRALQSVVGHASHAEGSATTASGSVSHAEGTNTTASGDRSHAEGYLTTARGSESHAEGSATIASELASHAEGSETIASGQFQHVQGKCNVEDSNGTYADIVGNGADANNRKNIEATTWTGDKRLKGTVYINCNDDSTGGTDLGSILQDYKETEQNTGKKWVNGDKVYSKTVIGKNKQITWDIVPAPETAFTSNTQAFSISHNCPIPVQLGDDMLIVLQYSSASRSYVLYRNGTFIPFYMGEQTEEVCKFIVYDNHIWVLFTQVYYTGNYSALAICDTSGNSPRFLVFDGSTLRNYLRYSIYSLDIIVYHDTLLISARGTSIVCVTSYSLTSDGASAEAHLINNPSTIGGNSGSNLCIWNDYVYYAVDQGYIGSSYLLRIDTTNLSSTSQSHLVTSAAIAGIGSGYIQCLFTFKGRLYIGGEYASSSRPDVSSFAAKFLNYTEDETTYTHVDLSNFFSSNETLSYYVTKAGDRLFIYSTARPVVIYSTDGDTWHASSVPQTSAGFLISMFEPELNGALLLKTLQKGSSEYNIFISYDRGATFTTYTTAENCMGIGNYVKHSIFPESAYNEDAAQTSSELLYLTSNTTSQGYSKILRASALEHIPNNHINTIPDFKHLVKCDRVVDDQPSEIEVSIDPTTGNVDVGDPVRDYEHLDGVQLLLEYTKDE